MQIVPHKPHAVLAMLVASLAGCATRPHAPTHSTFQPSSQPSSESSPIDITEISRTLPAGPIRGWLATIRLSNPHIQPIVSDFAGVSPTDPPNTEAHLQTLSDFVDATGATVAVNASFFSVQGPGKGYTNGRPTDVIGPWLANGKVLSPGRTQGQGEPVLAFRHAPEGSSTATISCALAPEYADAFAALAGTSKADAVSGCLILHDGQDVAEHARVEPQARHPRTAAGVSADGRTLYLLVIDGRQPGWSVGTTLSETAAILKEFGADDALNFDGGGSTSFIYRPLNGPALHNRPSDGHWRPVATSLGIVVR